jgi:hypothetical protein
MAASNDRRSEKIASSAEWLVARKALSAKLTHLATSEEASLNNQTHTCFRRRHV